MLPPKAICGFPVTFLSLLILHFVSLTSRAQGLMNHGPDNVYYAWDVIEGKDRRLFLCTTGGLYYSDNRGDSWLLVDQPFNNLFFEPHLVSDPETGDLWMNGSGVFYRSSDNGNTWNPTYVNTAPYPNLNRSIALGGDTIWAGMSNGLLYYPPGNAFRNHVSVSELEGLEVTQIDVQGLTLIVATSGKGLYRSTDGGKTWSPFNNGLPATYTVYGFNLHPGRWFVYGMEGTFESQDKGTTWHPVTNGLTTGQLTDLQFVGDAIYATSFSYDNVWRLKAGSDTWELMDEGIPSERGTVEFVWTDGEALIVGGWRGVYKRSVAAGPFTPAYTGVTDAAVFRDVVRATDGTIWTMATHGGVYSLSPGASKFTLVVDEWVNYGTTKLMHDTLAIVSDYKLDLFDVITRQPISSFPYYNLLFPQEFAKAWGGLYLSTSHSGIYQYKGNQNWQPINEGLTSTVIHKFRYYKGTLWAATDTGLFRRGANDDEWTRVNMGDANTRFVRVLYVDGSLMLASASNGSFVSEDDGLTWKRLFVLNTIFVEAFTTHDSRIYAASANTLHISPTDKSLWTKPLEEVDLWAKYPFEHAAISSLNVNDDRLYLSTWERGIWSMPVAHLFRKSQDITSSLPAVLLVGSEVTLDATADSGLPVTYRLLSGPASLDDDRLIAGDAGFITIEVYQAGDDTYQPVREYLTFEAQHVTGIGDEHIEMISVYPVPTNQVLNIRDATNKPVTATLVDLQGRALLSTRFVSATQFDLSHLAQGVYLVVVEQENRRVWRKKVVRN